MLANHKDKGLVMFRTKNKELARAGCKESKFRIRMREKKRREYNNNDNNNNNNNKSRKKIQ